MSYTHRMTPLAAQYDAAAVEKKWQRAWREARTYAWDESVARVDSYVIDTPPPTVSGTLHMGHVFSYTQADFIARYQRMTGKNVFYPMGFDDNGLPTERLVEKTIKKRAVDMSREDFIAECMKVSEEARGEFRALFESIALSVDWDQEYHTISEDSRRLSQLSFLDMVNKGECYRAMRPFYWDPVDQTAIASAEIEDKELPSFANEILFTCEGAKLIIMTTRPEMLPACVALFCHPEDSRYTHLHGKQAEVPLFGFTVPILTDDTVEMEKGTGLMMCCTFGDDADIAKWQKHKLPARVVINKQGRMDLSALEQCLDGRAPQKSPLPQGGRGLGEGVSNQGTASVTAPSPNLSPVGGEGYAGSPSSEIYQTLHGKKVSNTDPKHPGARQIIIEMLKEAGLLVKQTPITHAVKCAERSGAPLEILPTHQWFVKVLDKKEALKTKATQSVWNPEWMRLRIEQWIDGLNQDWCISRQRYFGVPFPVWYVQGSGIGDQGSGIVVANINKLPVNPLTTLPSGLTSIDDGFSQEHRKICIATTDIIGVDGKIIAREGTQVIVTPDPDVMDTWATSSISPQLSAHAIRESRITNHESRFNKLFPADLRPQAHEIIRTWAFYTIVKAHIHNDSVPWHNLMISGWCLAEDKSKMSKSKGNVVTPVALIEERGADAVRYWAATSRLGQDTAFSPDLLKIGKKLVGKLWNATAFAAIHLEKMAAPPATAKEDVASHAVGETIDRWILVRLGETVAKATDAYTRYEYADALDATNQFFWADFCDNYLELIKKRIYNEDGSFVAAAQQSAIRTVYYCLEGILKLYAPVVPHVTEELYSHIFADDYATHGSLHARGLWPKAGDYPQDAEALEMGCQAVEVLTHIRGAKSAANRSIKFPVALLSIGNVYTSPERWMGDVMGAGNVREWRMADDPKTTLTLADEADAA